MADSILVIVEQREGKLDPPPGKPSPPGKLWLLKLAGHSRPRS